MQQILKYKNKHHKNKITYMTIGTIPYFYYARVFKDVRSQSSKYINAV